MLVLAIALQTLAFVGPVWSVHRQMSARKVELLAGRAGELSREIERVRSRLRGDLDATERANLRDQLAELTRAYDEIDRLPRWPFDRSIRFRFTANYATFLLPLAGQFLEAQGFAIG